MRKNFRPPVGWGSPAKTSRFFQNSLDLIQQYGKLYMVTYGVPAKKYVQTAPSVDGVISIS
jgi:hypothetical protein